MKHRINTIKVEELLKKQNKNKTELSDYLGIPLSNISSAIKGDRNIPMDYLLGVSMFFKINPFSIALENDTPKKNNVQGNL